MNNLKLTAIFACVFMLYCANIEKENAGSTTNQTGGSIIPSAGTLAAGVSLANTVIEAPGHTGAVFYDKAKTTNGVRGGGASAGGMDIFSLDTPAGASTHVVLSWAGRKIKNGAGIDFIVFENAFNISGDPATRFMDLAFVEVSNDNINYCGFAPDYTNTSETTYTTNPVFWQRFAGRSPVLYNVDTNNLNAAQLFQDNDTNYEPDLAGGDAFDLDLLSANNYYNTGCTVALRDELKTNGFSYLKLIPANRRINPDTGAAFVKDGTSTGPDFDGVIARYTE